YGMGIPRGTVTIPGSTVRLSPEVRYCAPVLIEATDPPEATGRAGIASRPVLASPGRRGHLLIPDLLKLPPLPGGPAVEVSAATRRPGRSRVGLGPGRRRAGFGHRVIDRAARANR